MMGRRYNRVKKAQGGTGANQHVQKDQIEPSANAAESSGKNYPLKTADKLAAGGRADREFGAAKVTGPNTAAKQIDQFDPVVSTADKLAAEHGVRGTT